MLVGMLALIVAIGGTAGALPGQRSVGAEDLKANSVGARAIGGGTIQEGNGRLANDPVAGDGIYGSTEVRVRCPARAPLAINPIVEGIGDRSILGDTVVLRSPTAGPRGYVFTFSSDSGPSQRLGARLTCIPRR